MGKDQRKTRFIKKDWRWESDELTKDIVMQLQHGETLETRAFLRPIFRWMKVGMRKNGQRDGEAIEKAFGYVEWMVQLAEAGDKQRNIPRSPDLQPSYALNTIVTASQRAGSLPEALRAFHLLIKHGYEPDVFTYTALIDVTARNRDIPAAIKRYEDMRASKSRPNIVTFTTLIRAVSYTDEVDPMQCLKFLADARQEGTFDEALYPEVLEVCAMRKNTEAAAAVLLEMQQANGKHNVLRNSERFLYAIAQVVHQQDDIETVLNAWVEKKLITDEERNRIASSKPPPGMHNGTCGNGNIVIHWCRQHHLLHQFCWFATDEGFLDVSVPNIVARTVGCLGQQTTDSVRQAVVQHDITRLVERMHKGALVTTDDFDTLIHQCRKRKWKEEIFLIVNAMRKLADTGWQLSIHTVDDNESNIVSIAPQPQIEPTTQTYITIMYAYLSCGDEPLAWQVFQEISQHPHLNRNLVIYRKFVRGTYLLGNCDHIAELLACANQDQIMFTQRMCVEVARMHGYQHAKGVELLLHYLPIASGPNANEKKQMYLEELVKSCAYKKNIIGVEESLQTMLRHGFTRSAATETAVFIACLQHGQFLDGMKTLRYFQSLGLITVIPMYDSLLRELYFKFTRRGSTFDETGRMNALKVLYARHALFGQAFKHHTSLKIWNAPVQKESSEMESDVSGELRYWCEHENLECSPLMFAQHVVEVLTTIRDKESKLSAEQTIRDVLLETSDPFMFLLRIVGELRFLDLTYRGQGKLAKQMLSLLANVVEIQKHHLEYCVSQLSVLTVHIVKEIDDVVSLHRTYRPELLTFCLKALENDNMDKTIGFLVHRPELYTLENAELLIPKLAELYVLNDAMTVLQFFKPEVEDSTTMRRMFLREVIELESLCDDDDESSAEQTFPSTSKATREFKLEHEDEFMPFVMRQYPRKIEINPELMAHGGNDIEYLTFPLPDDRIVLVDSDVTVAKAYNVLMQDSVTKIGIDAEWRPDGSGGSNRMQSKCSILQIACEEFVFIFDLLELAISELDELFRHLLESKEITKFGFGLDGDIKRLRWSFPEVNCFNTIVNVLDFSVDTSTTILMHSSIETDGEYNKEMEVEGSHSESEDFVAKHKHRRRRQKGLSAFVKEILGFPLLKVQQKSDWEHRPLSWQQLLYAALDAYCLLMLDKELGCK